MRSLEDTPKPFKLLGLDEIEKLLSECTEKDRNTVLAQFKHMREWVDGDREVIDTLSRRLLDAMRAV